MSTTRKMPGGRADRQSLPKGPTGRVLCRWCAIEVPPPRRTFCSEWCVTEWRLRTDPGYLRQKVLARDRGICSVCAVDTVHAHHVIKRARGARRLELLARWGVKGVSRGTLWHADHVVPVAEGGGECDLENIRTLCLLCHRRVTAELRQRLSQARREMAFNLLFPSRGEF